MALEKTRLFPLRKKLILSESRDDLLEYLRILVYDLKEMYESLVRYILLSYEASLVWDPGNLVDGAGETSSGITLPGAEFGDTVLVGPPYSLQGILCVGYVSAADTISIRLQNETGGAINLASGTWKVRLLKAGI
jgi:hypothetical protein